MAARLIVGGVVGIAGPPYAHRRIRPIRRELILFVAVCILAMIRRNLDTVMVSLSSAPISAECSVTVDMTS